MRAITTYWTATNAHMPEDVRQYLAGLVAGILLLTAAGASLRTAAAQPREMQLSLREATAFALQGNLDIQIAGLTPRIRAAQVTEERGIYDVQARAEVTASNSRLLGTVSTFLEPAAGGLVGHDNSQEQGVSLEVSRLTPIGGTVGVELFSGRLDTTRRTSATAPLLLLDPSDTSPRQDFYENAVELRARQPLLKNFGATVTENQILIARNNLRSSQEEFRQQIIAITSRVQQAYWDLIFRLQDLEVRKQQLDLNQRLLEQIRKQVAVGTLAPIEVLQAETDIARTRERIIVAENAVREAEDRLKRVMNFSLTGELADVLLIPTDQPVYSPTEFEQGEQNRQALEQRPELRQAKFALENTNIVLVFRKNQLLPTLDVAASLRFNGIDTSYGDSFGEFGTDRYRWEVGLVFQYPLENRQARGRFEQAQLAVRQQMLRISDLEEAIIADVRAALRDVRTNAQRVRATRSASRLAQRQLEAEERKLQVGLATVFTVLDFQERLAVERSNEINALIEYMKALVRLEEAKGTLLQSYNIILQPDGPRLQ